MNGILELSILWRMQALRIYHIERMLPLPSSMPALEKFAIARQYMASEWLIQGYTNLVYRPIVLTDKEVAQLGTNTSIKILQIQAKCFNYMLETFGRTPQKNRPTHSHSSLQ
jgi:hypothetical protein